MVCKAEITDARSWGETTRGCVEAMIADTAEWAVLSPRHLKKPHLEALKCPL